MTFIDESSEFQSTRIHDVDREVVFIDAELGAMISEQTGVAVSGWASSGNDLSWTRSGVAFRVRFGTEAGERRAFFTETLTGTICNLTLSGPDQLSIRGTNELPPNP